VPDTIAEIKDLLWRSHLADLRTNLDRAFGRLTQGEAEKLLERLLSFAPGDQLPLDFRALHRAIRQHLLIKLIVRLGGEKSRGFYDRLRDNPTPSAADQKLRAGLRIVFPIGTEDLRDGFLKVLNAPDLDKMNQCEFARWLLDLRGPLDRCPAGPGSYPAVESRPDTRGIPGPFLRPSPPGGYRGNPGYRGYRGYRGP
jgi:hypothetical protein